MSQLAGLERGAGSDDRERRTREIGRDLFARIGRGPAPWDRVWWDDRLMALTMGEPRVKVQLFRFIDALPTLTAPGAVRRHLEEYLDEAHGHVPASIRLPMALIPSGALGARILAGLARFGAIRMARRFIAGSDPDEALRTVMSLRRRKLTFTADLLGEAVITEGEADAYQRTCLELLRHLAPPLNAAPKVPRIDLARGRPIPRVNLSLKLTSLTPRFDALHAEATAERVLGRLRPILRMARRVGAFVNLDMEQYAHKGLTHAIFRQVMAETEFRNWAHVGIVVQAYLLDALDDLRALKRWARARGSPITVRLVKGAYWDYEVLHARQLGWPVPVFLEKWRTDANYERCARYLLENRRWLRPALGSHNVRSLAAAVAEAEALGVPIDAYEFQMLHGMGEPIARALVDRGHRVRIYTPYGAMLPGMAYLVRRLLENTSNESFLKASFADHAAVEDLLRNPEEAGTMLGLKRRPKPEPSTLSGELPPFRNEPPIDFTRPENREAMRKSLEQVRSRLFDRGESLSATLSKGPLVCGPWVDGEDFVVDRSDAPSKGWIAVDPGDSGRGLALVTLADGDYAEPAVVAARRAFPSWSETPAEARAAVLIRAAEIMRRRRFELAAWEVHECGKPWREAAGDVAEAIDFCEFYAREMVRLAEPRRRDVPGETNALESIARGVVVVIPPWNFPLAIPTGMTVAALVAGNTVVLKPAEQSPIMAWHLTEILHEAGLPPGVLNYLPGPGESIGAPLVDHPEIAVIAFTGSRPVGLGINRKAAEPKPGQDHVKRVIAEMGGKNAIIIDDDADLDEAVVGVLESAFGYAGQKCSACSRVIVLNGIHDTFIARLVEAAKTLTVGPADDPDTVVGPLIDAEARDRVLEYIKVAESEGRIVLKVDVGPLAERGNFVGPVIVADVDARARVAQEEIFGPILAVLRARDLDEALEIANGTDYALTGGLYSRSPLRISRVKHAFRVGNLYINRAITGALVDRQPFGGFKLSGIGTKAGGPDYLREFLLGRTITENTMRRGFAPEGES